MTINKGLFLSLSVLHIAQLQASIKMASHNRCSNCKKVHTGPSCWNTDEDDEIDSGLLKAMAKMAPRPAPEAFDEEKKIRPSSRALPPSPTAFKAEELFPSCGAVAEAEAPPLRHRKEAPPEIERSSIIAAFSGAKAYLQQTLNADNGRESLLHNSNPRERRQNEDFEKDAQLARERTKQSHHYDVQFKEARMPSSSSTKDSLSRLRVSGCQAHQNNDSPRHQLRNNKDEDDSRATQEFINMQREKRTNKAKAEEDAQLARDALKQYYHHDRQVEEDSIEASLLVPHYEDPPGDLEHPIYKFVLDRPRLPSEFFFPLSVIPENEEGARRRTHFEYTLNRLEGRIEDDAVEPDGWKRRFLKENPHAMHLAWKG
jgi:hypothetical protein